MAQSFRTTSQIISSIRALEAVCAAARAGIRVSAGVLEALIARLRSA